MFACLVVVASGSALGACGGTSSTSSTTNSGSATKAAVAEISRNWVSFFSPSTPASTTASLLQNGTKFMAAIEAQAKSPFASQSSVTVSSVKLTSPTTATVTYTLKIAGQAVPGLKNATGMAIKTGNTWQIADATFCQLLKLQGGAPAACPKG